MVDVNIDSKDRSHNRAAYFYSAKGNDSREKNRFLINNFKWIASVFPVGLPQGRSIYSRNRPHFFQYLSDVTAPGF